MCALQIGKHVIGNGRVFVIAEAGVNHNGDIALAKKLIDAARAAHADAIKFQTFTPGELVTKHATQAVYQAENSGTEESQLEMLERLALTHDAFAELQAYAESAGILFLSTPFSAPDADFLDSLDVPLFKISSGEITNLPYLAHVASKKRGLILSTGMATLQEIQEALDVVRANGAKEIILLQCTMEYPTPPEHINLRAMATLRKEFNVPVGFSDHSEGILAPVAAAALGACIIEKHFTLDKQMPGPDHKASLEPDELKEMVAQIRLVELSLGSGEKIPTPEEAANAKVIRKSISARRDISVGTILTANDIAITRPEGGLPPKELSTVLGKKARLDIAAASPITRDLLE